MAGKSEIEALIDSLETLVKEVEGKGGRWKDIWDEIKDIGQAFKGSRFPSAEDRQATWKRFQTVIGHVKESQEKTREMFEERLHESKHHLDHVLSLAERAMTSDVNNGHETFHAASSPA